jgi:hypothetical protein
VKNDAQSVAGGSASGRETETWKLPSVVTTGDRMASVTESRCHHSPKRRARVIDGRLRLGLLQLNRWELVLCY